LATLVGSSKTFYHSSRKVNISTGLYRRLWINFANPLKQKMPKY
jgi:hypothetical protein